MGEVDLGFVTLFLVNSKVTFVPFHSPLSSTILRQLSKTD